MKILLIVLFLLHFSSLLVSQITSGKLSFIRIDSTTGAYFYQKSDSMHTQKGEPLSEIGDTTVEFVNGEMKIRIINRQNYLDGYETHRDSFDVYFNPQVSLTYFGSSNLVKLADFDKMIATNYVLEAQGYKKQHDFRMYADFFADSSEIVDFRIDKNDKLKIGDFEGYKVSYKAVRGPAVKMVKIYVCAGLKYPVKLMVNFPEDLWACPIYVESYYQEEPGNKSVIRLYAAKEVPAVLVENKRKAILLKR